MTNAVVKLVVTGLNVPALHHAHPRHAFDKAVIMLPLSLAFEIRKKSNSPHTLLCIFRHVLASLYFNDKF